MYLEGFENARSATGRLFTRCPMRKQNVIAKVEAAGDIFFYPTFESHTNTFPTNIPLSQPILQFNFTHGATPRFFTPKTRRGIINYDIVSRRRDRKLVVFGFKNPTEADALRR